MKYLILFIMLAACAEKQTYKDLNAWNGKENESVQLSVRSVKKKGKKTDLIIAVVNRYPHSIVIPEGALHFTVNNDMGIAVRPNPRWVINPGSGAVANLTFTFVDKEDGPGQLKLEPVYAGNDIIVNGVNSKSRSIGSAVGGAHTSVYGNSASTSMSGVAVSATNSNSEGYQKKSAVEGKQLPSVALDVP